MENVFDRLGIPETIYSDKGSEFTNNSFIQPLDKHKIEVIYATMKSLRMMDQYKIRYWCSKRRT
jgi:hypothetical protein